MGVEDNLKPLVTNLNPNIKINNPRMESKTLKKIPNKRNQLNSSKNLFSALRIDPKTVTFIPLTMMKTKESRG